LILLALGLVPKLGGVIASIPLGVLGGAGLALFGTVAASGIRALSRVHYEGNANLVIVAVSVGMGVIPIAVPDFYEEFPSWFQTIFESGISAAAVTAVLLNILFNVTARPIEEAEGPIFAEAPPPGVTPDHDVPGGVSDETAHDSTA
jgi:uric acid transporter